MASDVKPIVFIEPLSKTLLQLYEYMLIEVEKNNLPWALYMISNPGEISQLLPMVGPSLLVASDFKACGFMLTTNKRTIKEKNSKVIVVNDKDISQKMLDKFAKFGLTDHIREPIAERSLQYKVNLLVKSLPSESQVEKDFNNKIQSTPKKSKEQIMMEEKEKKLREFLEKKQNEIRKEKPVEEMESFEEKVQKAQEKLSQKLSNILKEKEETEIEESLNPNYIEENIRDEDTIEDDLQHGYPGEDERRKELLEKNLSKILEEKALRESIAEKSKPEEGLDNMTAAKNQPSEKVDSKLRGHNSAEKSQGGNYSNQNQYEDGDLGGYYKGNNKGEGDLEGNSRGNTDGNDYYDGSNMSADSQVDSLGGNISSEAMAEKLRNHFLSAKNERMPKKDEELQVEEEYEIEYKYEEESERSNSLRETLNQKTMKGLGDQSDDHGEFSTHDSKTEIMQNSPLSGRSNPQNAHEKNDQENNLLSFQDKGASALSTSSQVSENDLEAKLKKEELEKKLSGVLKTKELRERAEIARAKNNEEIEHIEEELELEIEYYEEDEPSTGNYSTDYINKYYGVRSKSGKEIEKESDSVKLSFAKMIEKNRDKVAKTLEELKKKSQKRAQTKSTSSFVPINHGDGKAEQIEKYYGFRSLKDQAIDREKERLQQLAEKRADNYKNEEVEKADWNLKKEEAPIMEFADPRKKKEYDYNFDDPNGKSPGDEEDSHLREGEDAYGFDANYQQKDSSPYSEEGAEGGVTSAYEHEGSEAKDNNGLDFEKLENAEGAINYKEVFESFKDNPDIEQTEEKDALEAKELLDYCNLALRYMEDYHNAKLSTSDLLKTFDQSLKKMHHVNYSINFETNSGPVTIYTNTSEENDYEEEFYINEKEKLALVRISHCPALDKKNKERLHSFFQILEGLLKYEIHKRGAA